MTGNENRSKRRLALAVLATALAAAATVQVASGVAKTGAAMGSLTFEAVLRMTSTPGPCPPGSPPDADLCAARTGSGAVRGLGEVSETYTFFVQEGDCDRVFETTVRLEVAGKGELQLAVDRYRGECISSSLNLSRAFTITGGSGIYAGASGGGTVSHQAVCHAERLSRDGHVDRHAECAWAGIRRDAAHAQRRRQQDSSGPKGVEARTRHLQGHRQRCRRRFGPGVLPAEVGQSLQNRPHLRQVLSDGHQRERECGTL